MNSKHALKRDDDGTLQQKITCGLCNKGYFGKASYMLHWRNVHSSCLKNGFPYKCIYCNEYFPDAIECFCYLSRALKSEETSKSEKRNCRYKSVDTLNNRSTFNVCTRCYQCFPNPFALTIHSAKCRNSLPNCSKNADESPKLGTSSCSFTKLRNQEEKPIVETSAVCAETSSLINGDKKVKSVPNYVEQSKKSGGMKLKLPTYRKVHFESRSRSKNAWKKTSSIICRICEKPFMYEYSYKRHWVNRHSMYSEIYMFGDALQCPRCEQNFNSAFALNQHQFKCFSTASAPSASSVCANDNSKRNSSSESSDSDDEDSDVDLKNKKLSEVEKTLPKRNSDGNDDNELMCPNCNHVFPNVFSLKFHGAKCRASLNKKLICKSEPLYDDSNDKNGASGFDGFNFGTSFSDVVNGRTIKCDPVETGYVALDKPNDFCSDSQKCCVRKRCVPEDNFPAQNNKLVDEISTNSAFCNKRIKSEPVESEPDTAEFAEENDKIATQEDNGPSYRDISVEKVASLPPDNEQNVEINENPLVHNDQYVTDFPSYPISGIPIPLEAEDIDVKPTNLADVDNEDNSPNDDEFLCNVCGLEYYTEKSFMKHCALKHSDRLHEIFKSGWKCSACSFVCRNVKGLHSHWSLSHTDLYDKDMFRLFKGFVRSKQNNA